MGTKRLVSKDSSKAIDGGCAIDCLLSVFNVSHFMPLKKDS